MKKARERKRIITIEIGLLYTSTKHGSKLLAIILRFPPQKWRDSLCALSQKCIPFHDASYSDASSSSSSSSLYFCLVAIGFAAPVKVSVSLGVYMSVCLLTVLMIDWLSVCPPPVCLSFDLTVICNNCSHIWIRRLAPLSFNTRDRCNDRDSYIKQMIIVSSIHNCREIYQSEKDTSDKSSYKSVQLIHKN